MCCCCSHNPLINPTHKQQEFNYPPNKQASSTFQSFSLLFPTMKLSTLSLIILATIYDLVAVNATIHHHLRHRDHRQDDLVVDKDPNSHRLLIDTQICVNDSDCPDGYRCGDEEHAVLQVTTCEMVEPLPIGSECDEPTDCESGLCHDGLCMIPLDNPCENDIDCITGRCDDSCLLTLEEGETCDEPSDCMSGHCADEKCVATCSSNDDCSVGQECLFVENVGSFCLDVEEPSSDTGTTASTNDAIGSGDSVSNNIIDGVPSSAPSVSDSPSLRPSLSLVPSNSPTETGQPSAGPSTTTDSPYPSASPSQAPSMSISPTRMPSLSPSLVPTEEMSMVPSSSPSSSPSELPSSIPSDIPSSFPSSMPSKAPTPVPTPTPCDHIHVELLTEDWVDESTISLLRGNIGLDKRGPFPGKLTRYTFDYCVDPGVCHEVLLEDEHGDGICCQYGNGYFKVYVNGAFVGQSPTGWWSEFHQPINCASNASYIGR